MKAKLLLLLTTLFLSGTIYGQCTAVASGFGNNTNTPSYNITGDVEVTLNTNNTITLNLGANFTTASGPDIHAYLVASNGLSDNDLTTTMISNLEYFEFGLVGASGTVNQNGAKTFTVAIPNGVDITTYDRVFFYCFQFNQFWDFGKITAFSSSNCSVLSIKNNQLLNTITFYPNPTNNQIEVSNPNQTNLNITIYNVLGKKVLATNNTSLSKQKINLSSLNSGVYLVEILANGKRVTKKLIKQ